MRRLGGLGVVMALLLAACTTADTQPKGDPGVASAPGGVTTSDRPERSGTALEMVPFERRYTAPSAPLLYGCGSVGNPPAYTRPVLVWFRVRVTSRVRLHPMMMAASTHGLEYTTSFVAPDPGPAAPHLAVSMGRAPSTKRFTYDTHLIGDPRDTPQGLAAATRAWERRRRLGQVRFLRPGDHYLFVRLTLHGHLDLHGLSVVWNEPGQMRRLTTVGDLSLRILCGG